MAQDLNLLLIDCGGTAVSATITHATVDTRTGTPRRGLKARIEVTAVAGTSQTATYKIQTSSDNTNWYDAAVCESNPVSATGEFYIPFETSNRYIRLVDTVAGTSPAFTYTAAVVDSRP